MVHMINPLLKHESAAKNRSMQGQRLPESSGVPEAYATPPRPALPDVLAGLSTTNVPAASDLFGAAYRTHRTAASVAAMQVAGQWAPIGLTGTVEVALSADGAGPGELGLVLMHVPDQDRSPM